MNLDRSLIKIQSSSSNTGKAKFFYRVVRSDENGRYVLHAGRRAYVVWDQEANCFLVDYWI